MVKPPLNYLDYIRNVPDFPKPGIVFRDITPLLANGDAFAAAVSEMACFVPDDADVVVGIEARGFIFGAALAYELNKGFVPIRKEGKLPAETAKAEYALEYGLDRLEIHRDALTSEHKAVIVDDLLATGGTAKAAAELVRKLGAEVAAFVFFIELTPLKGREKLSGIAPVYAMLPLDD
ncbi:MAG: adenine phosphoribosyltransferase [Zetaproteobacteria bacterium]|nr:MAG: adenine phosphoribosyltransferase [Zetaproteobacteria bacterium]